MIVLGWNRGRKQVFTGSVLGGLGLQGRLASYFGRFRQEFTVPEREIAHRCDTGSPFGINP